MDKKYTLTIHDALTGEVTERDMTAEELSQYEIDRANAPAYSEETTTE